MRWFIADTHFNHQNIISYDQRPFRDVKHMEQEIVSKWNNTVRPDDTVYHLGDFALGPLNLQQEIFNKLTGIKILIRGNHDGSQSKCEKVGWKFVCEGFFIRLNGLRVLLMHDPDMCNQDHLLVHGHTHKLSNKPNGFCVSCNLHNYLPVSESQIIKQLNRKLKPI